MSNAVLQCEIYPQMDAYFLKPGETLTLEYEPHVERAVIDFAWYSSNYVLISDGGEGDPVVLIDGKDATDRIWVE